MINVCIPTLSSYDTLLQCIDSVRASSIEADICIIDNGRRLDLQGRTAHVHTPPMNLGVAGSWNWFIDNVEGTLLITNDDIVFDTNAIENMVKAYNTNNIISPENLGTPFSCFILPRELISKVGKFDEWISPRYAYFEDNDYSKRMSLAGCGVTRAEGSLVSHVGSSTLKSMNRVQKEEHHNRFRLAREHYIKKWGGEPGKEKYNSPFGR